MGSHPRRGQWAVGTGLWGKNAYLGHLELCLLCLPPKQDGVLGLALCVGGSLEPIEEIGVGCGSKRWVGRWLPLRPHRALDILHLDASAALLGHSLSLCPQSTQTPWVPPCLSLVLPGPKFCVEDPPASGSRNQILSEPVR